MKQQQQQRKKPIEEANEGKMCGKFTVTKTDYNATC